MFDFFKNLGIVVGTLMAMWTAGDSVGWRPAWKWELDEQGWFNRRQFLLSRIHDNAASPHEIGEFCGLTLALKQPTEGVSC